MRSNELIRDETPSWISVSEAAIRLGVGAATVRRWCKSGAIRAVQPGGEQGVLRIPAEELSRLAKEARR